MERVLGGGGGWGLRGGGVRAGVSVRHAKRMQIGTAAI